ncbi:acetyl-CoA carboxylase biotin carboxyl carrier protein [Clostridium pasteurianum]|uniref:Biotin carboxyl carrier protein of acetyl-CoA carboxylase n=1 Tax=Clostridium pasteurianum BC1 TaxID=86416 RepID=R4KCT8_CLOPA|nr:acetyl-CoA carboxylase biotin carboxyl carrier protein [Clostridium pasteurianum]AGK99491.1 acetyl-CoA carboxylase, biotin carboxyl carrier protein [Clostridium pasteurianum BC1]
MDYKSIQQLIKTAGEEGLTFLEIETEGIRITMKKGSGNDETESSVSITDSMEDIEDTKEENTIAEKHSKIVNDNETVKPTVDEKDIKIVKSPIVGSFYASGDPKEPAFVEIGGKVKKGDTLCIIEAMKLMNEIQSEFDGEVVEISVENEQMVEYGQNLFKIKVK